MRRGPCVHSSFIILSEARHNAPAARSRSRRLPTWFLACAQGVGSRGGCGSFDSWELKAAPEGRGLGLVEGRGGRHSRVHSAAAVFREPAAMSNRGVCCCCKRFTSMPFKHSFSAPLEQTKNQSWNTRNGSWIVTPTVTDAASLANTSFCSGDCLFSYLFAHDMLSNDTVPDTALHFFKRTDEQRANPSPLLVAHGGADDHANLQASGTKLAAAVLSPLLTIDESNSAGGRSDLSR